MKYAVFTASLPEWTPEEALAALAGAGYDGIEWRVTDQQPADPPGFWAGNRCTLPFSSFVEDAPRVRALCAQHGIATPALGTYVTCEDLAAVEVAMRGAVALGAPQLRVGVPRYDGAQPYLPIREQARAQYREVAAMARQHGVRALIEIHMGNITPSASAAAAFLAGLDPDHVGAIHDAGNMVYEGYEQYRMGLEVLGPYLAHVHVKSAAWREVGARPDGSSQWQAVFAPLRRGVVDMGSLMRALKAVGYDRWLSVEDFSSEVPQAERVRDNLAFIRSQWENA
jgi:sugar phosphate isomerase/epimerase